MPVLTPTHRRRRCSSMRQVLGRNCRFLQGPDTDPKAVEKIRKVAAAIRFDRCPPPPPPTRSVCRTFSRNFTKYEVLRMQTTSNIAPFVYTHRGYALPSKHAPDTHTPKPMKAVRGGMKELPKNSHALFFFTFGCFYLTGPLLPFARPAPLPHPCAAPPVLFLLLMPYSGRGLDCCCCCCRACCCWTCWTCLCAWRGRGCPHRTCTRFFVSKQAIEKGMVSNRLGVLVPPVCVCVPALWALVGVALAAAAAAAAGVEFVKFVVTVFRVKCLLIVVVARSPAEHRNQKRYGKVLL